MILYLPITSEIFGSKCDVVYSLCHVLFLCMMVFLFLDLGRNVRITCRRRAKRTDTTLIEV